MQLETITLVLNDDTYTIEPFLGGQAKPIARLTGPDGEILVQTTNVTSLIAHLASILLTKGMSVHVLPFWDEDEDGNPVYR